MTSTSDPHGYRDRNSGQGGGYGQERNTLGVGPSEAPPRKPVDREAGGSHMDTTEAENWHGRSEREPEERPAGDHDRFAEDGYDADSIDAALSDRSDRTRTRSRNDPAILADLSQRLRNDDDLDATAVVPQVSDGVVRLIGKVDDTASRDRAEALAASVEGVAEIRSDLELGSDRLGPIPRPR